MLGFGAAPLRGEGLEVGGVAFAAPVGQERGIEPFAAEESTDAGENTELVFGGEASALGLGNDFGIGMGEGGAGMESREFCLFMGKSFPPCCVIRGRKVSQLCWHGGSADPDAIDNLRLPLRCRGLTGCRRFKATTSQLGTQEAEGVPGQRRGK